MFRLLLSLVLLGALAFAQDDPVVLEVQDNTVSKSEFEQRFDFYIANLAAQQGVTLNEETRPMFDDLRTSYLEQLATERVVLNIGRSLGLSVTDDYIEGQLADLKGNFESDEAFMEAMQGAGISDEAFLRTLIGEAELSRQTVAALQSELEIRDYQVQLFYDANRASLEQPGQTCARHILVETLEEAETIAADLEAGADFATLAQERSIDPGSGPRGGDLGCFGQGRMVPSFEAAAFSTPVGTVSAPTESEFGYHLILPYERQEASVTPLEEVEDQIREALGQQIVRQAIEDYTAAADIAMFPERLDNTGE